ncbi:DUF1330 domain-containing protein [Aequorivita lipolytica]|jgi:uncharacterized protein (DUF1330 family)|uniref:DUF1330 domain-containing protein n=1 Tax=Aequorivita lipolytica TaxID=153267 RepID=A0A5C6YSA6_9FLAO|nr:DUF1330 domain-containing protein [Aequorivita lipolytica]TXD69838.1 DUF1330 domain-containing protein [Aequorivita lipolytica]SRX50349.1 hypothetical protein AEQU2_00821 [Aequorivita lipolytica]
MKPKIFKTLFLILLSFAMNAQGEDPHGNHESAVTGMPLEKILMVLDITVHDSLQYQQYRLKVEPLIEKFGGTYLVRSGGMAFDTRPDRKIIPGDGNWNPNRFIIVQWDSMEALQKFTDSEEYKATAKLRENSATTKSIIVKKY